LFPIGGKPKNQVEQVSTRLTFVRGLFDLAATEKESKMSRHSCRALILALVALVVLPVVAGQPGKYIVTRDITPLVCNAAVIDIQVPPFVISGPGHVDIDLNGFRVSACPGHPVIRALEQDNITVRNGTLAFADQGVLVIGGPDGNRKVVVEDVKITDVLIAGIQLEGITDFALRRNNVVTTDTLIGLVGLGQTGIIVNQAGAPFQVKGTIEDNQVERTGGGILIQGASSVAIKNNRIADLVAASPGAIVYAASDNGLIAENTVETIETGGGIVLDQAQGCKIYNNVVRGANGDGIYLTAGSDDNLILDNVSTQNGSNGLRVESDRNHIERNVLNSNGTSGQGWGLHFVVPAGPANTMGRNTAHGNTGPAPACPAGGGPFAPTNDFCDEGPGVLSWGDNFMPFLF
jgi:parallel beta-helix repeat protein